MPPLIDQYSYLVGLIHNIDVGGCHKGEETDHQDHHEQDGEDVIENILNTGDCVT